MKIYNFEQQSPEWFEIRRGKVTASHATAIGNCGKGLDTYVRELMAEYFSSGEKEHYANEHTERGNELEAQARKAFELQENLKVEQVGFVEHNEYVGCSPDGLVGDDHVLEIKCPSDKEYFNILMEGEKAIDSGYIWQCQMNMLITSRKSCYLVYYNPNFNPSMRIFKLDYDPEKWTALAAGFVLAESKIKEIKDKFNSLNA